jgi:hypothetical protein
MKQFLVVGLICVGLWSVGILGNQNIERDKKERADLMAKVAEFKSRKKALERENAVLEAKAKERADQKETRIRKEQALGKKLDIAKKIAEVTAKIVNQPMDYESYNCIRAAGLKILTHERRVTEYEVRDAEDKKAQLMRKEQVLHKELDRAQKRADAIAKIDGTIADYTEHSRIREAGYRDLESL